MDQAGYWWAYVVLFLCVTASWAGVPGIGSAAAGVAGVAASQGELNLALTILVTTVAGEVGGLLGYRIGARWGHEMMVRPGRHQAARVRMIERGERLYDRWGRLAVFVTPAIVSGTARMRIGQFAVWNLLASFVFAMAVVASAYGIGRVVTGNHGAEDIVVLLLGVAAGVVIYLVARRRHKNATPAAPPG